MTRTIRVSERTYERIDAQRNDGETTAETLDRLVGGRPLADFAGGLTDDEAEHARETVAAAETAAREESSATLERALDTETAEDGERER